MKMENEFGKLMYSCSKPLEPDRLFSYMPNPPRKSSEVYNDENPPSSKSNMQNEKSDVAVHTPTLIDPLFVRLLSKSVQQLVQVGHQQQCYRIYRETRTVALEANLKNLGVEKLSKEEVKSMLWESLDPKIENWVHAMLIAVKLLFASERQLSDQIFDGFNSLRDQCFAEVTGNSMTVLVGFGEAVSESKRSPEKLFALLNMNEIMHELRPEIETIFEGKAWYEMRASILSLAKRLAQTVKETFCDLEDEVEKHAAKTIIVADEGVHPLARSEAKDLLDDNWIPIHRRLCNKMQINTKGSLGRRYFRVSQVKIWLHQKVTVVEHQDLPSKRGSKDLLRLKYFNMEFEEIYPRQCGWQVQDQELRESLRLSVAEILLPAYRSFLKRFRSFGCWDVGTRWSVVENSKNPRKYVKFTPEKMEQMLGELFEKKAPSEPTQIYPS